LSGKRCFRVFANGTASHGDAHVSYGAHAEGASGIINLLQLSYQVQHVTVMTKEVLKVLIPIDYFPFHIDEKGTGPFL
jgi:hypothetical protein